MSSNPTSSSSSSNNSATPHVIVVDNYVDGRWVPPSTNQYLTVTNPATGAVIGQVALSGPADVDTAVRAAHTAFPAWSERTIKARAAIMLRFHALVAERAPELAELIVSENGKNITEALADVAKGNETVEYAGSLPQLAAGRQLTVSSGGVVCRDERRPLGVVVSIVPFNFPFMVPCWTFPIALVMGNCVVLKPSEKVPLTMRLVASELIQAAGFPNGVFNLVQGTADAVESLITHPDVKAVTFVGSSAVAQSVAGRCRLVDHKRCTALGGAKNHLVVLPDCDIASAAVDICVSFAGCAGQRCMAASVLLLVTKQTKLLDALVQHASRIALGTGPGQMGPVIDAASYEKIVAYIEAAATTHGARILLDGRQWSQYGNKEHESSQGHWLGPTILLHQSPDDPAMRQEVFGPVLSVYICDSWDEAMAIENANDYGNAASVYTTSGAAADWFVARFRAAMLGVNIGIPVPREPFSFGGLSGTRSKYGDVDITGDAAVEFFSQRIKVTSKWPSITPSMMTTTTTVNGKRKAEDMNGDDKEESVNASHTDRAHFSGSM